MKSLTSTQICEIQNAISLITSAYNEGHISKEVEDEACSMLRNQLQNDDTIKHTCLYALDVSDLHDLEQQYHATNGTVCCVLNTGKLYMYFNKIWMELEL